MKNIRTIRNWLNTIFIFAAIAGMIIYYQGNRSTGSTVIVVAMAFKFVEVCLRMYKGKNEDE